jgi:hypothetical protein
LNRINLKEEFKKLHKDDIDEAQERDYDLHLYDLQYRLQGLYDEVFILEEDEIPNKIKRAKLDLIFVHIQELIEQGEEMLSNKLNK